MTTKPTTRKKVARALRLAIFIRDGFKCVHCACDLSSAEPTEINLDHVTPFVDGGSDEANNLITSCERCNKSRQDKPIAKFHRGNRSAMSRVYAATRKAINVEMAKTILKIAGEAEEGESWLSRVRSARAA